MTAISFPPLAVKASGVVVGPLSSYADNGSAADAEVIIQQFENEIELRRAQMRIVADRGEELTRQAERRADEAAQAARDEVMAGLTEEMAALNDQMRQLGDEALEMLDAVDEWQQILAARRAAEGSSYSPVPPPPGA